MNNIERELFIPILFFCNITWNLSLPPVHLLTNTVDVFCIDSRNYFVVFILVFALWFGSEFLIPLHWELDSRDERCILKVLFIYRSIRTLTDLWSYKTHEIKKKEKNKILFLKRASNYSMLEWKRSETMSAEEYCWTITQEAGWSCSSVLEFWFQLDSCVHKHVSTVSIRLLNSELHKIRHEPDHPGRNYCVSQGRGEVLQIERTVHRSGPEKHKNLSPIL